VDAGGAAGLGGRVDRHVLRTFGDALLLSLLAAGAQLSQPQASGFGAAPSAGNVAAAALGQELSAAGLELVHRDVAVQPTLRLPAATPLLVFVNGDLDLAPLFAAGAPPAGSASTPRGSHARP
jgi:type IV secretory pathway VirB10-like protein